MVLRGYAGRYHKPCLHREHNTRAPRKQKLLNTCHYQRLLQCGGIIRGTLLAILFLSPFVFFLSNASAFQSALSDDTNLTIWDDTDSVTKKSNEMINFFSNYTNHTSQESINLTDTWCSITFNTTGTWAGEENMSFNPLTSQYEYNKTSTTKGDFAFNVTCNDDAYNFTSLADTFTVTNTLPTISSPLSTQSCTEDVICTYNFFADVSDPDTNDVLTYGYDAEFGAFSGFSISASTGIVTVNVTVEGQTNDTESVRLTVVDTSGDGVVSTKNFTLTFVNDTPLMTVPSNLKECTQDVECFMQITAADEENDSYSFNSNSTLFPIDSETGVINVTINNSGVGSYWVNLSVNDSAGNTASAEVNITVFNVNDPPSLDYVCADSISAVEDVFFECEINATDPDLAFGDTLTFSTNESWLSIESNGSNATVNFTANDSQVGAWFVTFSVSDASGGLDSRVINITVANVSDAPSLNPIGELSAFTGILFYYDVNATDEDLFIPDTTEVLYFSVNDTSLFDINSSTGEFSFTPSQDNIGTWWINLTVNDTEGVTSSEVVNLTVYNNTPPDFSLASELAYVEDYEFYLNLSENASDAQGDELSFSANYSILDINGTTGEVNVTLNDSFVGENWVNFTVTDSHGAETSMVVNITVYNVDDLPNFTEPLDNYQAYEDSEFFLQVNGSDEDLFIPQGNVFGITENLSYFVNDTSLFDISSDGIINFTPNNTQFGQYWFNVSILDNTNNSYSELLNLTVSSVNDRPYFTEVDNITAFQSTLVYMDVNATDEEDGSDTDVGNTNLTFWINTSEFDSDADTSIINSTSGVIEFTPNSSHVGTHYINLSVNDSEGLSSSMVIAVVINATNNAPSVASCTVSGFSCDAPCSCVQPVAYENSTNTTFTAYTQDLDDDTLSYEWLIDGVSNKTGTGTDTGINTGSDYLVYTPGFFDSGEHNITLYINDSTNVTSVEWNVTVLNLNSPPTFDLLIQNISWNQDTDYSNLDLDAHFTDLENQTELEFTWTQYDSQLSEINSSAAKVNISVSSSHTVTFSPVGSWYGFEYVTFYANDSEDSVSSNEILLNVTQTTAVQTTSLGGGGGGGGGGGSATTLVAIDIIHADNVSFIQGEEIISPIKIKNTNSQLTLHNINLSVETQSDLILAQLDRTFIESLSPSQEEYVNIILSSTQPGIGEVTVIAEVGDPPFRDTAKYFVNVAPPDPLDIREKIVFVKDLFKENPECLELNEVVSRAEKALNDKKYDEAASLIETAINKCKDLITSKSEEKPMAVTGGVGIQRFLILTILYVITSIILLYLIRKIIKKRRENREHG